ncbi:MAG: flagellar filament capping protein FliD, partial [Thermoleophilia bacterium]|nr:flagellar filament capping protein FliD [Thermoleophilia bacterium]
MSQFSIGGLSSGLDTKKIISQLMSIESTPKTKLQWNQQLVAARKSAWTDLNGKLASLKTASDTLLKPETWDTTAATSSATTYTSTSSDPSRLGATVLTTPTPTPGTYSVQVSQLAQGEITKSSVVNGTIGANDTLTITQGGTTWNVAVTAGDTFADVVTKINAATGNNGVSASIEGGAIKLQSTGVVTGAGASSAFSVTGATAATLGFGETQSAQNAIFYVNGAFQQSETNFGVTTAIPGVSLNLNGTTAASITVAQTDSSGKTPQQIWEDSVVSKVKEFAAAYNSIQTAVYQKTQAESKVTTPANKTTGITLSEYLTGPMARNTCFAGVATQLRAQTSGSVSGLPSADSMLASIGINTGKYTAGSANGLLTVDEAALRAELKTPAGTAKVQAVLGQSGAAAGITADDGIARRVTELAASMTDPINGVVGASISGATADDRRLADSIE